MLAAIGSSVLFGFNEVLHGSKLIIVPEGAGWQHHGDYVDTATTPPISATFWDLYVEIGGGVHRVISLTPHDSQTII